MKSPQQPADDLADFRPLFRGPDSCVADRIYQTEESARFCFRHSKAALIDAGIVIKRGRNWYAHPTRLKAYLLDEARRRARAVLERDRAMTAKPADDLSVGQKATTAVDIRRSTAGKANKAPRTRAAP